MKTKKNKRWILSYSIIGILLIAFYYLIELEILNPWEEYIPLIKKLSLSLFLISTIFLIGKIISDLVKKQNHIEGDEYNLLRIIRFLSITLSLIVVAFFYFKIFMPQRLALV